MGTHTLRSRLALGHAALALAVALPACASEPSAPAARDTDAAMVAPPRVDAGLLDASAATGTLIDGGRGALDAATTSASDAGSASLIDHQLWKVAANELDPFSDGPVGARCEPRGVMSELLADEPVFSIDTGVCSYLTVTQPSQRDIAAGERIKVRLWHFALSAPTPAEAHAAVLVDGIPVLDERVPIPAPGGLLSRELRVDRAVARGAPVHFHLHNHGANSWSLVEVSVAD